MKIQLSLPFALIAASAGASWAQETPAQDEPQSTPAEAAAPEARPSVDLDALQRDFHQELADSLAELSALQERLASEKIPLNEELRRVEAELTELEAEYQAASSRLASRNLDLTVLGGDIERLEGDAAFITQTLLGEYVGTFESKLHISERQVYGALIEAAKLANEDSGLDDLTVFEREIAVVHASIDRLEAALGGVLFEGSAVSDDGAIREGSYVLLGPTAVFRSSDGAYVGTAVQRAASKQSTAVAFGEKDDTEKAEAAVASGSGLLPIDVTLGSALELEATNETLIEHIQKGGAVMWPIGILAGCALLVALYKWLTFLFVRKPSDRQVNALLDAVSHRDEEGARAAAANMKGPVGSMLRSGVDHLREPRELIEEVMYEKVLTTRLRLEGLLPFISICAASAPLLGLLGTVTGIIETFRMITVFGSGDVKSLSGGISEALITTKFGLIVAIPSLLLHAFLARRARGIVSQMETTGVAFVNQASKVPGFAEMHAPPLAEAASSQAQSTEAVREQVREALTDLLVPSAPGQERGGVAPEKATQV